MTRLVTRWLTALVIAILHAGCRPVPLPPSALDPEATFAAHRVPSGLMIDRMADAPSSTGFVQSADLFRRADLGGGYSVLSRNGQTVLDVRGSYEGLSWNESPPGLGEGADLDVERPRRARPAWRALYPSDSRRRRRRLS